MRECLLILRVQLAHTHSPPIWCARALSLSIYVVHLNIHLPKVDILRVLRVWRFLVQMLGMRLVSASKPSNQSHSKGEKPKRRPPINHLLVVPEITFTHNDADVREATYRAWKTLIVCLADCGR
jgi:hypothetical protein